MSKKKNKAPAKRRLRRLNKNSIATHDIMAGRAVRRGWGKGILKGNDRDNSKTE